jgi:hypothetical protein
MLELTVRKADYGNIKPPHSGDLDKQKVRQAGLGNLDLQIEFRVGTCHMMVGLQCDREARSLESGCCIRDRRFVKRVETNGIKL